MTTNSTSTMAPTICNRSMGREGASSGEATNEVTLTLRRGRMRG